MKRIALSFLFITGVAISQETEKPFMTEHILHKHEIHVVNSTVYQQIKNYGAFYSAFHVFGTLDFTEKDKIVFNTSATFGNGIIYKTEREGYSLTTTADDLEDYLEDINETDRKYLLELYYQRKLGNLTVTGGLIDSTAFIDSNRYANDEHTQFLNSAFVNNPIAVLPSYNLGGYFHYRFDSKFSMSGIYMQNKPDKGNVGIFEIEYETENFSLKPYYYYLFGAEENKGVGISIDYSLSNDKGFFFRAGFSNTEYESFYSSGFQLDNVFFNDYLGFGYGFLKSKESKDINVGEVYYSINLNRYAVLTADIQYMEEEKSDFIYGFRVYLSY